MGKSFCGVPSKHTQHWTVNNHMLQTSLSFSENFCNKTPKKFSKICQNRSSEVKETINLKKFRGAAPNPAGGLTAPPRPPAEFLLGIHIKIIPVTPLPYIQGTSEAIRRVLGQLGIRTAMRSSKIKWSIMKGVKDKQKEEEIPGVVYAIGCGDCRKVYVGETRRTAAQRVKEHKSDTRLGHLDKSAVAEHAHTTGHHVHWKAMVVEREQHGRKRKVKEAPHIRGKMVR